MSGKHEKYTNLLRNTTIKNIINTSASTPEGFTDNSTMLTGPSMTVKNTIVRKSLRQFSEVLDAK